MIGEPHLHHGERLGGDLELLGDREPALWSAPRTWVAGEVLTASLMNVHLRDQLQYLGEVDARLSSPPATPRDGQLWRYVADGTAGVEWLLAYNAAEATYKWHALSGPPLVGEVTTPENRTLVAYGDLTTVGPSLTLARAGDYDIAVTYYSTTGADAAMSYTLGATAAVDADAALINSGNQSRSHVSRERRKTLTGAGSAITAKYHSDGVSATTFSDRRLRIAPVRII